MVFMIKKYYAVLQTNYTGMWFVIVFTSRKERDLFVIRNKRAHVIKRKDIHNLECMMLDDFYNACF